MHTREMTRTALMTALLCILAPISFPVGTVAVTLATFAIYLMAYILPPKQALFSVSLYLCLGTVGIPVFSGYMAGIQRFAAPGGGYLIGYLLLAGIGSAFVHRFFALPLQVVGLLLGTLAMYITGTFWLAYSTGIPFLSALPAGMLLFLPLDMVKLLLAAYIGRKLQLHIKNKSL